MYELRRSERVFVSRRRGQLSGSKRVGGNATGPLKFYGADDLQILLGLMEKGIVNERLDSRKGRKQNDSFPIVKLGTVIN